MASQVNKVKDRFGLTRVVLAGDRGMLTAARLREDVRPAGLDWITALRAPQVKKLVREGDLQLTLSGVQAWPRSTCRTSPDAANLFGESRAATPGKRSTVTMHPGRRRHRRSVRRPPACDGGARTGLRQLTGLGKKFRVISISLGTRFAFCGSAPPNRMFSVTGFQIVVGDLERSRAVEPGDRLRIDLDRGACGDKTIEHIEGCAVQRDTTFLSLGRVTVHVDAVEHDAVGNDVRSCLSRRRVIAPLDERPPSFLCDAVNVEELQAVVVRTGRGRQHRGRLPPSTDAFQAS